MIIYTDPKHSCMRLINNNSNKLNENQIYNLIDFIDSLEHNKENINDIDINNSDIDEDIENNKNFKDNMDVIYEK